MSDPTPSSKEPREAKWDALVNHPQWGSLWLDDCRIEGDYVIGTVYETAPDGYHQIPSTMNFPVTCIRKKSSVGYVRG